LDQRRRTGEVRGDAHAARYVLRLQPRRAAVEQKTLQRLRQLRCGGDGEGGPGGHAASYTIAGTRCARAGPGSVFGVQRALRAAVVSPASAQALRPSASGRTERQTPDAER